MVSNIVSVRGDGTSKRPRKKKTVAELKEEETLLLKERKKLRSEIATMRLNIEKQRATNESLNRLKRELDSPQKMKTSIIDQAVQVDAVNKINSTSSTGIDCNDVHAGQHSHESNPPHKVKELESEKEPGFSLPDLNLPAEGDFSSSEVLYGIS
ncbi:hypothetical protein PanWU01x14_214600 [Parasponia andersonii]|uniref:Uncharacterized protein n=1 Tax=Parasponia andersonii TaxID=3476 RepID=A0A2P5BS78_PARAD|nr:hypothetical protein PanWU01x14_214600 [Parasponia andersonii]